MSGLKDVEATGRRQLESLRRGHEREAARLESGHKDRKVDMRKSHTEELVDIRHENLKAIDVETEKKEKVLNEMSQHLETTRKLTDRQIGELKQNVQKTKATEHARLGANREKLKEEHELHLLEANHAFNEKALNVNYEGRARVDKVRTMKEDELMDREGHFKKKLSDQNELYTTRIQREETEYVNIKKDQDLQFKQERLGANTRQQVEVAKLTEGHNKTLGERDQVFRKGVKDQDLAAEKRYAENLAMHNKNLEVLKNRNEQVVTKMKTNLGEQISTAASRKDDPFYNFTELKPHLENTNEGIIVKVAIPEHSKQDVQIAFNGKEVIINYTRRHNDTRKTEDSLNKVQKVESFSSRLTTAHILNPKTLKSAYSNGIMTYTISKA